MSFPCPKCKQQSTVEDTRKSNALKREGFALRRRRICLNGSCRHRFSTLEMLAQHGGKGTSGLVLSADRDVEKSVKKEVANELRWLADKMEHPRVR